MAQLKRPSFKLWKIIADYDVKKTIATPNNLVNSIAGTPCSERLLSCNRRVNVCDDRGNRSTNESSIDKLYALNHFYNGSPDMWKEDSTSLRHLCSDGIDSGRFGKLSVRCVIAVGPHRHVVQLK
jgi:hypothetical protein